MNIRDEVLKELENHKGDYISGGQLSKKLSVSRNAVWKAINRLKKDGYEIQAIPNRGYCLSPDNDILSPQSISKYLKHSIKIEVVSSVSSTNTVLKEKAAKGAPHGTVLVARKQTSGRGRMGKEFFSPVNTGLYFSILLRPDFPAAESLFLTTSAAVAVAKAIEDVSRQKAGIKWVNDVYIENKKVCGILTEAAFNIETNCLDYAVVGIGINLCPPQEGMPAELRDIATTVFQDMETCAGKSSVLMAHILDYFFDYYDDFPNQSYVEEYINRSIVVGKNIRLIDGNQKTDALALEMDKKCRLKVRLDDGTEKWICAGEVSIKLETP